MVTIPATVLRAPYSSHTLEGCVKAHQPTEEQTLEPEQQ